MDLDARRAARVRYVTSRFTAFQGLTRVPLALLCLAYGLYVVTTGETPLVALVLVTLALAVAPMAMDRYYKRAFGSVTPTPTRLLWEVVTAVANFAVVGLMIGAMVLVLRALAPVLIVAGVGMGIWQLLVWRRHAVVLPSSVAFAALLPVVGLLLLLFPDRQWVESGAGNWAAVATGVAVLIGGVLDHLVLTRTVRPIERVDVSAL